MTTPLPDRCAACGRGFGDHASGCAIGRTLFAAATGDAVRCAACGQVPPSHATTCPQRRPTATEVRPIASPPPARPPRCHSCGGDGQLRAGWADVWCPGCFALVFPTGERGGR